MVKRKVVLGVLDVFFDINDPHSVTELVVNMRGMLERDAKKVLSEVFVGCPNINKVTLCQYKGFNLLHHLPKKLTSLNLGSMSGVVSDGTYLTDEDIESVLSIQVESLGIRIHKESNSKTLNLLNNPSVSIANLFFWDERDPDGNSYDESREVKKHDFHFHGNQLFVKYSASNDTEYDLNVTLHNKNIELIDFVDLISVDGCGVNHSTHLHSDHDATINFLNLFSKTRLVGSEKIKVNNLDCGGYQVFNADSKGGVTGFGVVDVYRSRSDQLPSNIELINEGRVNSYFLDWSLLTRDSNVGWVLNNAERVFFEYSADVLNEPEVSFGVISQLVEKNNGKFNFFKNNEKTSLSWTDLKKEGAYELPEILKDVMQYHYLKSISQKRNGVESKRSLVSKI